MEQQVKEFGSLTEVLEDLDHLGITGAQRYRAVSGYLSMKARYADVPISGAFELTPLCNLDCKMCYVHLTHNQIRKDERLLSVAEWKSIIKQAVDAGMMYATLTGGECMTYPAFKEVYSYICSLGIQPDILTNGRLLTAEMVQFLSQNHPGVMQVSLYGSCEDAYEKVTGHRAFQQVYDGILRAKAAGLNVIVSITPNRFMQDDTQQLLQTLYALNVPYVIGASTLPARPETQRDIDDYAVDMDAFFEIHRLNEEYCKTLPQSAPARTVPRYIPAVRKELQGLQCGGAHSSFHVTWKGELCPCIPFATAVHSSMLDKTFADAWKQIREQMLTYKPPKECGNCKLREYCVTCAGEKGMNELNGQLNPRVCEMLRKKIELGKINVDKSVLNDMP